MLYNWKRERVSERGVGVRGKQIAWKGERKKLRKDRKRNKDSET